MKRKKANRPFFSKFRRASQIFFFALFFLLLTLTVWPLGSIFLGAFLVSDPLIGIVALLKRWIIPELLLSLLILALPLFLGRFFCGYICPFGFLIEITSKPTKKPDKLIKSEIPVYILLLSLILLITGSAWILIFDPISMITRSMTGIAFPLLNSFFVWLSSFSYFESLRTALYGYLVLRKQPTNLAAFLIFLFVLLPFLLSFISQRAWCRHFCPLGSLFAWLSRFSLTGRKVDHNKCIECGMCEAVCPMGAVQKNGKSTDTSRCQLGFECAEVCPTNAISFGLLPERELFYPERRKLFATGAIFALGSLLLPFARKRDKLLRPPGARDYSVFLETCVRCNQCVKICPTNVIQPSIVSGGVENLFTPHLDFEIGYCEWNCSECGKVCPTAAIKPLSLEEKHLFKIGRAFIDRSRCIPWSLGENCIVCQELCPVPEKAIKLEKEGDLLKPRVDPELCIGCGVCEYNCPIKNPAAIRVFPLG